MEGVYSIKKTFKEDVFIVGYPKSGNTWIQNLISGVVYGLDKASTSIRLVRDLVPDIYYPKSYTRYQSTMFFKSHELPNPKYKKVIYIVRDGRDVMVSYHAVQKALGKQISLEMMVKNGEYLSPCKWYQHVKQWKKNPYNADKIIIRYEDLQANPLYR